MSLFSRIFGGHNWAVERELRKQMVGEQLARLTMDGQRVEIEETLVHGIGRIRDVRQGPDGYIYLAIDNEHGEPTPIVRLEPAGEH